jgi:hypothetical protein
MLRIRRNSVAVLGGLCIAATGLVDDLMIFPNAEQTPEQR